MHSVCIHIHSIGVCMYAHKNHIDAYLMQPRTDEHKVRTADVPVYECIHIYLHNIYIYIYIYMYMLNTQVLVHTYTHTTNL